MSEPQDVSPIVSWYMALRSQRHNYAATGQDEHLRSVCLTIRDCRRNMTRDDLERVLEIVDDVGPCESEPFGS